MLTLRQKQQLAGNGDFQILVRVAIIDHVGMVLDGITDPSNLDAGEKLAAKYRLQLHNPSAAVFQSSTVLLAGISDQLFPNTDFETLTGMLASGDADASITTAVASYYPKLAAIAEAEESNV